MANAPTFATTPNLGMAQITTATTARDGSGAGVVTAFTAGSNGARVDRITATATATTAAGSIMVFINDGTNTRLYREIPVTAVSASTTAAAWYGQLAVSLVLPAGHTLRFGSQVATGQPFNILVEGANF